MIAGALEWLYPSRCALCERIGHPSLCDDCRESMLVRGVVQDAEEPLEFRVELYAYEGRAAQAVKRLKYSRATSLAKPMAELMAPKIAQFAGPDDLVVPVPIHRLRRIERGFNQAELLCEGQHGRKVDRQVLRRRRHTLPQASLTVSERLANLEDAFQADSVRLRERRVLLIDDVLTTGGTARECARALLAAGAPSVGVLAFAGG